MKHKKLIITAVSLLVLIHVISAVFHERFGFYTNKAALYASQHAYSKSHNRCAWHVMLAMNAGGQPVPLLRACDYEWYFKKHLSTQFEEIQKDGYKPMIGDVVVFRRIKRHPFGHIAMWNGTQWVSDFKQRGLFPSKDYAEDDYVLFRPIIVLQ